MIDDFLPPDQSASERAEGTLRLTGRKWAVETRTVVLLRTASSVALGVLFYILTILLSQMATGNANAGLIPQLFVLLIIACLARALFSYWSGQQANRLFEKSVSGIRSQLILEVRDKAAGVEENEHNAAHFLGYIQETESIAPYFSRYVPQVTLCKILPVLVIAYIFFINWISGLIVLLTAPVVPVFMVIIGKGAAAKSREQWATMSAMGGYFLDTLRGVTTLHLFSRLRQEMRPVALASDEYGKSVMEVLRIAFLSGAVLDFFSAVAISATAIYTGLNLAGYVDMSAASAFTLNNSLLVLLLVPEFFNSLKTLGVYYHDRTKAVGAMMHLQESGLFMGVEHKNSNKNRRKQRPRQNNFAPVDEHNFASGRPPKIVFNNVIFGYKGGPLLFERFNLVVEPFQKIRFNGSNGSGKTTLLFLLLRWREPLSGHITLNGVSVRHIADSDLCETISWIGQHTTIFQGTIRSNILMGASLSDEELYRDILTPVSLLRFIKELPLGLDTPLAEDAKSVSGGEKQKIALARALVKNSKVLLLDEPLNNLDQASAMEFMAVLERTTKNRTVIITGHGTRYQSLNGYRDIHL